MEEQTHLVEWMLGKGAEIGSMEIRCGSRGRGLFATKDLQAGEICLIIPSSVIITPVSVETPVENWDPNTRMVFFLIHERKLPDGIWKHYINSLPKDSSSTIFLSRPSSIHVKSSRHQRWISRQHSDIFSIMKRIASYLKIQEDTPEWSDLMVECRWAYFIVMSRTMYIPVSKMPEENFGLVPYADMLNHDIEANLKAEYVASRKAYVFKTLKHCRADEELIVSYGFHSNKKLLKNYGFILPNNPFSHVRVWWKIPPQNPKANRFFETNGFAQSKFLVTTEEVTFPLMFALRLCALEDLGLFTSKSANKVINEDPLGEKVETKANATLKTILADMKKDLEKIHTEGSESEQQTILKYLQDVQDEELLILQSALSRLQDE
eukprot:TRINITY_DN7821_c0_g1_i1.p1 TRINITY_DN7821_c0_g1~~TRINITY_DN7821_c0_g1_i1.p1  ORF type:complete len:379 (-),score=77.98 TRINITY_DN7821_c0_g1_i1:164-1300(-)